MMPVGGTLGAIGPALLDQRSRLRFSLATCRKLCDGRGGFHNGGARMLRSITTYFSNDKLIGRPRPEVSLIVTSYQKPRHLRLTLASIAMQRGVEGRFELIVADDGSTDETPALVERFAMAADFPVKFTTHPHESFQVSRTRNEGVSASVAPYLIFIDGDCLVPPDFVDQHLKRRRRGAVMFGDRYQLEQEASAGIDVELVQGIDYQRLVTRQERRRLAKHHRKALWYNLIRHPTKPRLLGSNFGLWRADYERVNGFDENYEGWGCEDDDFGYRLRAAGVKLRSIVRWTCGYHVWHPRDPSWTPKWRDGNNVAYLLRDDRPMRCVNGLEKLMPGEQLEPAVQIEWPSLPFRLFGRGTMLPVRSTLQKAA
jgi:glycosyltransferase involved in cell wall biosynthesis